MKTFKYIPRISIVPGPFEEERINEAVRCCKEYSYDEVMLFINAESLFKGFLSVEELKPYVETIKKAKVALEQEGIKTSLNPWTTLGHGERGKVGVSKDRFAKMVGDKGIAGTLSPCPLDEEWQDYLTEYFSYLVAEIKPNVLWFEDDFRLGNHGLESYGNEWGGGCFCERHMKLYGEYMGREIALNEFVDGIKNGDETCRKAFYEVNRKQIRELAELFGKRLREVYPELKIGLMAAGAKAHSIEGRDWNGVLYGFAQHTEPIQRVHLPMYRQTCAQDYGWIFNDVSMEVRALVPEETVILPELESAQFSPFTKSRNMTCFQVESSLALCPKGITFDQDCFAGSGIVDAFGYGEPLKALKPYLDAFVACEIPFSSMKGVVIPTGEDLFMRAGKGEKMGAFSMTENYWAQHLSAIGVAYAYKKGKCFENEIVGVAGNFLNGLTDDEVVELFEKNFLLLDGASVEILFERGLNRLINAKQYKKLSWRDGQFSFEQAAAGKYYAGMNGARTSAIVTCPSFLKINYSKSPKVYTNMKGYEEEYVAPALVNTGSAFILPYDVAEKPYVSEVPMRHHGLLSTMRQEALKEALQEAKQNYSSPVVYNKFPYVSTYYYQTNEYDYYLFVNFSDDSYSYLETFGIPDSENAEVLDRASGEWVPVEIFGGVVNRSLLATTTMLIRMKK